MPEGSWARLLEHTLVEALEVWLLVRRAASLDPWLLLSLVATRFAAAWLVQAVEERKRKARVLLAQATVAGLLGAWACAWRPAVLVYLQAHVLVSCLTYDLVFAEASEVLSAPPWPVLLGLTAVVRRAAMVAIHSLQPLVWLVLLAPSGGGGAMFGATRVFVPYAVSRALVPLGSRRVMVAAHALVCAALIVAGQQPAWLLCASPLALALGGAAHSWAMGVAALLLCDGRDTVVFAAAVVALAACSQDLN